MTKLNLTLFSHLTLLMLLSLAFGLGGLPPVWADSNSSPSKLVPPSTPMLNLDLPKISEKRRLSLSKPMNLSKPILTARQNSPLIPFLDIIPTQDGTGLIINVSGLGQLVEPIIANLGPSHDMGGWSPYEMTYSGTLQAYYVTTVGLTPQENLAQSFSLTTTSGLDSGPVRLVRAYLPASTQQTIPAEDGKLTVEMVNANTLPFDSYLVIVPSYGLPGPLPAGHTLIGSSYSLRLAGAVLETDAPFLVKMTYDTLSLQQIKPDRLTLMRWEADEKVWTTLQSSHLRPQQQLSASSNRLTSYALVAKPNRSDEGGSSGVWLDEFDDFSGLVTDEVDNLTSQTVAGSKQLTLRGFGKQGQAVSKPIQPDSLRQWQTLHYTDTVTPPTTTLSIDILTIDNQPIFTGVPNHFDLQQLDPIDYPALKLRAVLTTSVLTLSPSLDAWQLTWRPAEITYLPLIVQ